MINFSRFHPESFTGKLFRIPFRALPREMVVPVLQGPLRGKKWIVGSHLHSCWLGSYEWKMQQRIAQEVRPRCVFYDIGANVGFYSLLAAGLVASGKVYAMEPLPENVRYLRKHLALNRIRNVEVLELAICDQVGTALFEEERTRAMGRIAESGNVRVETSTLDVLVGNKRIAPPDFIKMDVEGAEYRALLGAQECFARYRPILFLATHGQKVHQACCDLLGSWGYEHHYTNREAEDRSELFASPAAVRARAAAVPSRLDSVVPSPAKDGGDKSVSIHGE